MQKNLTRCLLAILLLSSYACDNNNTRISSITVKADSSNTNNVETVDVTDLNRGTGSLKTENLPAIRRFDPRDAAFNLAKLPSLNIKSLDINDKQAQIAAQQTVSSFNTIFAKQYDKNDNPNWRILFSHRPISDKKYLIAIESSVLSTTAIDVFSINGYAYNNPNSIKIAPNANYILFDTELLPEGQYIFRFQNVVNGETQTYFYSLIFDNSLNF
jgi:hypothetical protein